MKAAAPQPSPALPKAAAAQLTPVLVESPPVEELDEEHKQRRDAHMSESLAERVLRPARPKASAATGYADLVGPALNREASSSPNVDAASGAPSQAGDQPQATHQAHSFARVVGSSVHSEPMRSLQFSLANELTEEHRPESEEHSESGVFLKCDACLAGAAAVPEDDDERRVQRKSGAFSNVPRPQRVHAVAEAGVENASDPLPHLDQIQPLFAPHDLSGIRTQTGGAAADANQRLGSVGYTVGERVGFRSAPDVGLVAHEATHVIQQRQGATVPNGVGQAGDDYERQADTVAKWAEATIGDGDLRHSQLPSFGGVATLAALGSATAAGAPAVQRQDTGDAADNTPQQPTSLLDTITNAISGVANEAVELGEDALLAIVRGVSPLLADIIQKGPSEFLRAALESAVKSFLASLGLGGMDLGATWDSLAAAFNVQTIAGLFTNDGTACERFAAGINALRDLGERFMNSPLIQEISAFFGSLERIISSVSRIVLEPAFEVVKTILGAAWDGIAAIGKTVWEAIQQIKNVSSAAFDWVARKLGFPSATGEGGLTAWISNEASEIWETVKSTLQPLIGPLKTVGGALAMLTGVGELYLIVKYAPEVISAIRWLWAHKDDPDIIRSAHEQMGNTILPQLLEAGSSFANVLESGFNSLIGKVQSLASGLLELLGAITGVPLLSMAKGFITDVSQRLNRAILWGTEFIGSAVTAVKSGVQQLYAFCRPFIEVLLSLAMAVTNPEMIPVILAGWAWRELPNCVKPPIIDLLLDAVIGFLQAMPDFPLFGLLWPIIKSGVLGFLETVRALQPDEKIKITNKLAVIMSGSSPEFMVGFVVGLLKGLWDMLVMPFELVWQLASGIVHLADWLGGTLSAALEPHPRAAAAAAGGSTVAVPAPGPRPVAPPATPAAAGAEAIANSAARQQAAQTERSVSAASAVTSGMTPENARQVIARLAAQRSRERAEQTAAGQPRSPTTEATTQGTPASHSERSRTPATSAVPPTAATPPAPTPAVPTGTQPDTSARVRQMAEQLRPPATVVSEQFMPALQQYFSGRDGMTLDDLAKYLGQLWESVLAACQSLGATIAQKASAFFLGDGSEYELGYGVGYVVGMVVFQAVLDFFTDGLFEAVPILEEILAAPAAAMEEIAGLLSELGEMIFKGLEELGGFLSEAGGGALEEVMTALREIAGDLVQFGRELLQDLGLVAEEGAVATEEAVVQGDAALRETETALGDGEVVLDDSEAALRKGEQTEAELDEAGQKAEREAAEHAEARAEAMVLDHAEEAAHVPAALAVLALDELKAQFEWIDHFEARPKGLTGSSIWMIGSEVEIDDDYEPHLAEGIEAETSGKISRAEVEAAAEREQYASMSEADLNAEIDRYGKGTPEGEAARYERYKRAGGESDYDEWWSQSRGGRGGGAAHEKIRGEIQDAFNGSNPEVKAGERYADVYTPNGPNGKPIYHQIGDINPVRGDPIVREREAISDIRKKFRKSADIYFWPKGGGGPLINPDLDPRWLETW